MPDTSPINQNPHLSPQVAAESEGILRVIARGPNGRRLLADKAETLAERVKAFEPLKSRIKRRFPHSPEMQEDEAARTEEGQALRDAKREYDEVETQVGVWGDDEQQHTTPAMGPPKGWTCGHPEEDLDRQCKACSYRFCAECQPDAEGSRCKRCSGPVWLDSTPPPPETRNPQMRGY